jgi:hypothetical protein
MFLWVFFIKKYPSKQTRNKTKYLITFTAPPNMKQHFIDYFVSTHFDNAKSRISLKKKGSCEVIAQEPLIKNYFNIKL